MRVGGIVDFDRNCPMLKSCELPIAAAILLNLPSASNAHQATSGWTYPPACCKAAETGGDCQQIPDGQVAKRQHGYSVFLYPGDHRRVTKKQMFFIPYGDEIPSGDSKFHICLHPTEDNVNCFFAPPDGF